MTEYTILCDVMISKRRRAFAVMRKGGHIVFWANTIVQALSYVIDCEVKEVTLDDNGVRYKITFEPVDGADIAGVWPMVKRPSG